MRVLLLAILFYPFSILAQEIKLSDQATISLITCSFDERSLLTEFGHSALRVYDPACGIDNAYHYGVLDFHSPDFLIDFVKGELGSRFAVSDYSAFKLNYTYFNRPVNEQSLNLTPEQKQKIFNYLNWNALPENRIYHYDYFTNNCGTKLRDVFIKSLGNEIQFELAKTNIDDTYRNLLKPYLVNNPWTGLLFDVCLGLPADRVISIEEKMLLPYSLKEILQNSKILHGDTLTYLLIQSQFPSFEKSASIRYNLYHPQVLLGLVGFILVAISIWDFKSRKISLWVDWAVFCLTGLIGTLLLICWLVFNHKPMGFNMNLFWALPVNLLVMFIPNKNRIKVTYFLIATIITGFLLVGWIWLPQKLSVVIAPLVVGFGSRYFVNYLINK